MGNHALLSASSSARWLHCPPSARLGESYDDVGSDYAREGTCAHELCEYKLKKALGTITVSTLNARMWIDDAVFTSLFDEPSTAAITISSASMELKPVSTLPI